MSIDFLLDIFSQHENEDAIVWRNQVRSYSWLLDRIVQWDVTLDEKGITPGVVTTVEADFSPSSVALFLALVKRGAILVPLTGAVEMSKNEFIEIGEVEAQIKVEPDDSFDISRTGTTASHEYYGCLRNGNDPGLVLFSSGSTGKSKAAVHNLTDILQKFKVPRRQMRAITFLLYDHIGGVNTMLYTLSNGGCIVTVSDRSPDNVLEAVERWNVDLLPTSPTFLNLILVSEAYKRHSLESLKVVTYGTEPMPQSTLERFNAIAPHVTLQQTYGLSEVGILRSKSRGSNSLWMKVGGEGFETRIVDDKLQIKAESAMLGYLNAPSPFTEDGWMETGDRVEVDGDWLKILGRDSELINVGGEKVHPAEVESVIQEFDNVVEVTVFGEKNPIMGSIVCAQVRLNSSEDEQDFAIRLKQYCRTRMAAYKIPIRVTITDERLYSSRFKKVRTARAK